MPHRETSDATKTRRTAGDRELSGKLLPAAFTLLGLAVGFYGVIYAAIGEAGPWKAERSALLPFLSLVTFIIIVNCLLAILAVLDIAGYVRARLALVWMTCLTLAAIALFVLIRSLQLFI